MKELNELLRDYVTPEMRALGLKKKGREYALMSDSGDAAFVSFPVMRIDPRAVVFHVYCSLVPLPYWQWLKKQHLLSEMPEPKSSGALASFSVVPPECAAYEPTSFGFSRTRWAFDDVNRDQVGRVLAQTLVNQVVPKIRSMLNRENLLTSIKSSDESVLGLWDTIKSELVLMVDEYSQKEHKELLARLDPDDPFALSFVEWAAERNA